jgi:hypothetical protein
MTTAPEVPPRTKPATLDQYRRWARFLFALLAIVTGIGLVLTAVAGQLLTDRLATAWPLVALIAINVGATLVVLLLLIRGLGLGTTWVLHAVAPVCYVLIAFGTLRALLGLAGGQILIPFEAIGALLVLTRPHGAELLPVATDDDRRRMRLVTAVLVVTYFLPLILQRIVV